MTERQYKELRTRGGSALLLRLTEDFTDPKRDVTVVEGTVMLVDKKIAGGRFMLRTPPCAHCGVMVRLSVPYAQLEVVENLLERSREGSSWERYVPFRGDDKDTSIVRRMRNQGVSLPPGSILLGRGDNLALIVEHYRKLEGRYVYVKLLAGPSNPAERPYVSFIGKLLKIIPKGKINTEIVCQSEVIQLPLGTIIDLRPAFARPTSHFHTTDAVFLFDDRGNN